MQLYTWEMLTKSYWTQWIIVNFIIPIVTVVLGALIGDLVMP